MKNRNAATQIEIGAQKKKELFRQTRHENEADKVCIEIEGKQASLRNWSRTGIGFELSDKEFGKLAGKVSSVNLTCGGTLLYSGEIEIKRTKPVGDGHTYYGASFAGDLFLVDGIDAALAGTACANRVHEIGRAIENVNPEFCQSVLALAAALREIKSSCEAEEARWRSLNFDQRCESERVFVPSVAHKVKSLFIHFNVKIAKQVDVDNIPEDSLYHKIFNREIYPYFETCDFIRRAYEKPRGYAGDYEMMNQIYRNGFEGSGLFGRVLHHYMTNETGPESVRFRKPYFMKFYRSVLSRPGVQNILAVACGPAVEFQGIVESWSQQDLDRISVTLFDLDREALEHAQLKIHEISKKCEKMPSVNYVNANVKAFLTSSVESGERYDLIYSGGLFDYLDNLTSAALVRKFYSLLNPGGYVVIGNFTKDNKSKAFQHLLTNWTMVHKTEDEMKNWATGISGCEMTVEYDPHHMNAFLVVKKDAR